MMGLLYATIWVSLAGLLLGELGRRRHRQTAIHPRWSTIASGMGAGLALLHAVTALGVVYHWDHDLAARVTAERAAAIYGPAAGPASLYVNYLFLTWWMVDTWWWWHAPARFIRRGRAIEWAWRLFAFTMVLNGAVIFASPAGRVAGIPLCAALLFVWANDR